MLPMEFLRVSNEIPNTKYLAMCLVPVDQQMTGVRMKVIGQEKG